VGYAWNQRILICVVIIFECLQLVPVQSFLNWSHVTLHFELILNLHLLIKHVFILLLIALLGILLVLIYLGVVTRLKSCLVLVKLIRVVHFGDVVIFISLHLQLCIIEMFGLIFLLIHELLFFVKSDFDLVVAPWLPFLLVHQLFHLRAHHVLTVLILIKLLQIFSSSLFLQLFRVILADSIESIQFVLSLIKTFLSLVDGSFEIDWIVIFFGHHFSLPLLPLGCCLLVPLEIWLVSVDDVSIDILFFSHWCSFMMRVLSHLRLEMGIHVLGHLV